MILGIGLSRINDFGHVPDPNTEGCADGERDETLCMRCKNYEVDEFGIPSCCGNEFEEADMARVNVVAVINNMPDNADSKYIVARVDGTDLWYWGNYDDEETANKASVEIDGIVLERA